LEVLVKRLVLVLLLVVVVLALAAPPIFPANKTETMLIQLQTAVAQLQSDMRDLRSAMDERMGMIRQLVEQQTATVNKLNTSIDQVQRSVQTTVTQTMTAQGAKVDAVAGNTQAIMDTLEDMKARVARLGEQMTTMRKAIETLQIPPPQPAAPQPPAPDVLYDGAFRDYSGGNVELAMHGFQDYLKYYPNGDRASNAQFYIGEVYYRQKDYKSAIDAYNLVLDRYPDGNKTAAAHLKKGYALMEMNNPDAARAELNTLIRRFAGSDEARLAQERLKTLGAARKGAAKAPTTRRSPDR
jgi:tol-pal system protein YbgF